MSGTNFRHIAGSKILAASVLVAVSMLCGWLPPAGAQAWTMPRGEAYLKLSYAKTDAARQYTFYGRTTDFIDGLAGDTFRDRSLYLYGEFGFSDEVSMILSIPYKRVFIRDQTFRFRTFAVGTVSAGVRLALLPLLGKSPSATSAALNLMLGIPTGYTRNLAPSAGSGQVDIEALISVGHSFWPFPAYAQVGAGYRYRSSMYGLSTAVACQPGRDVSCIVDSRPRFGDEWIYRIEAGITPFGGGILLQALAGGAWSLKLPTTGFSAVNPIPTRQRFLKIGGGVSIYPFRLAGMKHLVPLGLNVQYFATPTGRNTLASRDLFVGVEYRTRIF